MPALYNEIDEKAAAWLRELIARGLIAPGVVNTSSIEDLTPNDLRGFTQVHFFAGIGVWSHALRGAGWPDDRPVWTGSCPCQPFSAAGKGAGFDDERHLWPSWFWLIEQCRPATVFGEQVASKDAEPWIDLVQDDLEALGYGVGAVPFPAAGVGAPHIRDRLYWVADANDARSQGRLVGGHGSAERAAGQGGVDGGLAHPKHAERRPQHKVDGLAHGRDGLGRVRASRGLADDDLAGRQQPSERDSQPERSELETPRRADADGRDISVVLSARGRDRGPTESPYRPGPTNGLWRDADWLLCRDGKFRPVEPGTFPLAHGAPARVGRLRGYGNGLVGPAAQAFIEAWLDTHDADVRRLQLGVFA